MNTRIAIYTDDVAFVTGKSIRSYRSILRKIRIRLKKGHHQIVTFKEFADYTGVSEDDVRAVIFQ